MSSYQLPFALVFVFVLTLLMTFLEVFHLSKSRFKSVVFNLHYLIYFLIQLIGNVLTTLLATYLFKDKIPEDLNDWRFFIYAILGAFSFYGILSNANINFLDAKLLTIQEWIQKAKDSASEAAIKKDLLSDEKEKMDLALKLKECDEDMINTSLFRKKNQKEKTQFLRDMARSEGDQKLYKCFELVSLDINSAKALVDNRKKELAKTKKRFFNFLYRLFGR